jgi:hypothetical protein
MKAPLAADDFAATVSPVTGTDDQDEPKRFHLMHLLAFPRRECGTDLTEGISRFLS